ncbi:unnamed protein product [Paramecium primaurelia]|uniref:Uncharacterized protein n=2 Tax=Paramecium TaxID=5884 RepID=A0A8S1VJY9_9CILI|nr:unnamed protein product [Paramecium primaurelia]CAD8177267.1 unnamed protein product [Paramecium pentaurelia]
MNSSQKLKESQIPEKEKDKNKTQKSKEDAKEALKKIVEQARQAILENKLNATEEVHKAMIEYKEILGGENSVLLLPGLFIQAEAYIAEGKLKKAEEFLQAAYWNLYQYNKPKEKGSEDGNKMGQDISEKENAEYNGQLHKIFSKLYFAQKDYKKALAELTIGIYTDSCSSDPEHPQTSLNYYYMGQIFQQKKQTSEAEQFYAKTSQCWYKYLKRYYQYGTPSSENLPEEVIFKESLQVLKSIEEYFRKHIDESNIKLYIIPITQNLQAQAFVYKKLNNEEQYRHYMGLAYQEFLMQYGENHKKTKKVTEIQEIIKQRERDY